jgi:hypothetical protein
LFLWLGVCIAVLVFAFVQREIHDADIAFTYLMLFLTFPLGWGLTALIGVLFSILYSLFSVVVPGGFVPNLAVWFFFVAVGYFQWFVLIPWLYRKVKKSSNPRLEADAP